MSLWTGLRLGGAGLGLALVLTGCGRSDPNQWQGYLEAEFVYVGSPLGGTLVELKVQRGDQVKAGAALFVLEQAAEQAAQRETFERLQQAKNQCENLKKGRRPTELAALEARLAQAQSALEFSKAEHLRWVKLFGQGVVSAAELDGMRTTWEQAQRLVEALSAELATARLGARDDEVRAAEAEVAAAAAALAKADWAVSQKSQAAPGDALVQDTLFRPGEWVPPGSPVVSLLPPPNLKVRFFIPEARLGLVRLGQVAEVTLDGLGKVEPAVIRYLAPQPEYTPPVIYSQENRAKLVFMVEATFERPDLAQLHPGQPVTVRLRP